RPRACDGLLRDLEVRAEQGECDAVPGRPVRQLQAGDARFAALQLPELPRSVPVRPDPQGRCRRPASAEGEVHDPDHDRPEIHPQHRLPGDDERRDRRDLLQVHDPGDVRAGLAGEAERRGCGPRHQLDRQGHLRQMAWEGNGLSVLRGDPLEVGGGQSYTRAEGTTTSPLDLDERTRANRQLTPYVPRLVIDWLRATPEAVTRTVDGSLVFADISGFTRLSEALARRGKVGAELMRDALNDVFTALLDDAYDYGAGLIKWGGDAVLLLFDEPDHEARACRAAWEMQRTLDRVGRLRAPGGTVTLRMSVGITSGLIEFFLVGSVHRELLVGGPPATEAVTMEGIADAGEIALSPHLAARLDPACSGAPKEEAILLA